MQGQQVKVHVLMRNAAGECKHACFEEYDLSNFKQMISLFTLNLKLLAYLKILKPQFEASMPVGALATADSAVVDHDTSSTSAFTPFSIAPVLSAPGRDDSCNSDIMPPPAKYQKNTSEQTKPVDSWPALEVLQAASELQLLKQVDRAFSFIC